MTSCELVGCIFGLLGAFLLSLNTKYSGYGFVLFLGSNMAWLIFAFQNDIKGLLLMQIGFTITSMIGIYRWRSSLTLKQHEIT